MMQRHKYIVFPALCLGIINLLQFHLATASFHPPLLAHVIMYIGSGHAAGRTVFPNSSPSSFPINKCIYIEVFGIFALRTNSIIPPAKSFPSILDSYYFPLSFTQQ